jgi:hypothetical protein
MTQNSEHPFLSATLTHQLPIHPISPETRCVSQTITVGEGLRSDESTVNTLATGFPYGNKDLRNSRDARNRETPRGRKNA